MTGRNTDYYEAAFAPLRQGDLDIGAPAAPPLIPPPSSLIPPVPFTWTEAHRHACEVRHVENLAPVERETYLQHVAEKRGKEAAARLRRDAV
jgi:hypothetical protein